MRLRGWTEVCGEAPRYLRWRGGLAMRGLFGFALAIGLAYAGEPSTRKADLREWLPSADGAVTCWLVAPPRPPITDQKEGAGVFEEGPVGPIRAGDPCKSGGVWKLHIAEASFVDLRSILHGARSGTVWCVTRMLSKTGGERILEACSYGEIRVYLDGQPVIHKPEPAGFDADGKSVRVTLPKGGSQVAVAVGLRYGYCGFGLRLTGASGVGSVGGDCFAVAFPEGQAPSLGYMVSSALSAIPERYFVKADDVLSVGVGVRGGFPPGMGPLTPRLSGPNGVAIEADLPDRSLDELQTEPWRFQFTAPRDELDTQPQLRLSCEILSKGRVLGAKQIELFSLSGIRNETEQLRKTLEAVQRDRLFANTALAVEKLELWFDRLSTGKKYYPWPSSAVLAPLLQTREIGQTLLALLKSGRAYLEKEREGKDPFAGQTGYIERAYCSSIDRSAQPYFLQVPESAREALAEPKGEKRFPLIIFLHGYVQDYHKYRWWVSHPELNGACDRLGAFLALPFARSNADFLGAGEVDVLDVVEDVKRRYPIDSERVYLYGYSMGGMGVYSLGGHYPDLWAAGIVIAGRADSPLLMGTEGLDTLAPFKQYLVRVDQPLDLCENFVNIPLRIYHGETDYLVKSEEAERMHRRLREVGCDVSLLLNDGDHWFGFDLIGRDELIAWLLSHRRENDPRQRRMKSYSLRFGACGEVRVNHVTGGLAPFDLTWTLNEGAVNFQRLTGPLSEVFVGGHTSGSLLPPKPEVSLVESALAGKEKGRLLRQAGWVGQSESRSWNPEWKSPVRCGPVKEATYGPFLIVYGTSGGAAATARLKGQALAFAEDWYVFAKGLAAVKADREVSAEEKRTKNFILFGEEQENGLHALAAATGRLPITVKAGEVRIGAKTLSLKDRGILYIYPSPFEGAGASCSIVISAGIRYGGHLPINHKWDLVPDVLVYTGDADLDGTKTNKPVMAGFFDGRWRMDPATTWWFDD